MNLVSFGDFLKPLTLLAEFKELPCRSVLPCPTQHPVSSRALQGRKLLHNSNGDNGFVRHCFYLKGGGRQSALGEGRPTYRV